MPANPLEEFAPGNMTKENYEAFDLHKHSVDSIVLVSSSGSPMRREADLIDVWFDSGSMPYAQWHYPFENKDRIDGAKSFPADFIAEGVDQTRGWFYTLHAIATMVFDSVAYKNVVSNGLVLDKKGLKMSKRLGNGVDPFETLEAYGPDATRWYMISNAQPWDNLKFDADGIVEVQRKFFGTLHNTYNFLALYAKIDGYLGTESQISVHDRPEIDRWILSRLHSLIQEVDAAYGELEPTKAARAIQEFTIDELSNWHVRLSRRRFWKGEMSADKLSAYQTLHECLKSLAVMASPIAPFYCDRLHQDINPGAESVHLMEFPQVDADCIDTELEERMKLAQQISSQALSLRKREKIRVRQPLRRILVPVLDETIERRIRAVEGLIRGEINVKQVELLKDESDSDVSIVKRVKPDFKALGPRFGKRMKSVAAAVNAMSAEDIVALERDGQFEVNPNDDQGPAVISTSDVEIMTDDIPGWLVSSAAGVTVALDITLDEALRSEGVARELINRVQGVRKDCGLEVTDRIQLTLDAADEIRAAIEVNLDYIRVETLADEVKWQKSATTTEVDLGEGTTLHIGVDKLN